MKRQFLIDTLMKKHYLRITAINQTLGLHPASTMKTVLILLLSAMSITCAAHTAPANLQKKDTLQHLLLREDTLLHMLDESIAHLHTDASARTLPFAVQQIDGAELVRVKDANFVNALAGRVAGATINASSAGTGGAVRVLMRGARSTYGNNGVLYVVDGIPLPQLSTQQTYDLLNGAGDSGDGIGMFNADDIENLYVLTGAAATTLYGNDAVNGVILINTKKGRSGRPVVNVSNSTTFSAPLVMPEFQNRYGSYYPYYGWGDKVTDPSTIHNPADFFRTGHTIMNTVSVSVGSDVNQTYFSVATQNAHGIIPNNDVDRYNVSFRNTSNLLDDRLKLDLSFMYMGTSEQNMLSHGDWANPLPPVYLYSGMDDFNFLKHYETYDPTLGYNVQDWPHREISNTWQNPYWTVNRNLFNNEKDRFLAGLGVKFDLTNWLSVSAHARFDKDTEERTQKHYASTVFLSTHSNGYYYVGKAGVEHFYADFLLNFHKSAGHFSAMATLGAGIRDSKNSSTQWKGDLVKPNVFAISNLLDNNYLFDKQYLDIDFHDQTKAFFLAARLGYRNMLFLDLAGRMDKSGFLGLERDYQFYPSVGASVVLTELLPIKSSVLPFLKARFMYTKAGNSAPFQIPYSFSNTGAEFSPDLEPEYTESYEAGLDATLLDGRMNLGFTIYKSTTSNQMVPVKTYKQEPLYVNAGAVENKGIELSLGFNQDFGLMHWSSNLVYSINKNKIKDLSYYDIQGHHVRDIYVVKSEGYFEKLTEGGSIGDFYSYEPQKDEDGNILVSEYGSIYADYTKIIYAGNPNPKYTMGWANSFSWKGIELNFVLQARVGGEMISFTQSKMDSYGVSKASADARDNGGVWIEGKQVSAEEYYQSVDRGFIGTRHVYSATNVRLSEASIAYNIPVNRWLNWIQGARVALVGRNLLMLYNKAPFDPEITASTGTYLQGVDHFKQPSLRNVGFSVNLRF